VQKGGIHEATLLAAVACSLDPENDFLTREHVFDPLLIKTALVVWSVARSTINGMEKKL
jgi:hypothetical protein